MYNISVRPVPAGGDVGNKKVLKIKTIVFTYNRKYVHKSLLPYKNGSFCSLILPIPTKTHLAFPKAY